MNKPYDDAKWANYLANAKTRPYDCKIQGFGSVVIKNGKYMLEKKYVYSEFYPQFGDWRKKDETTILTELEGSKEAEGLIAFRVEMRNYDPMTNPNPHQWYLMTVKCKVPDNVKNVLLTKSYAFKLKSKSQSIIQGGFVINDIANEASQKLTIDKPHFKETGSQFGWIEKGKPKKATITEVLKLFNNGELLAIFASEDWGRHGRTTKYR